MRSDPTPDDATQKAPRAARPRESLKEYAIEFIIDYILDNDLAAGEALPSETALGDTMGVSRVVVREACQVLSARGIVDVSHGRGMFVSESESGGATVAQYFDFALRRDPDIFAELLEVRRSLEVQAAGMAASRANEDDIERLVDALNATEDVLDDFESLAVADVKFHGAILRAAGNRVLLLTASSFDRLLVDSRRLTYAGAIYRGEGGYVALAEHRRILEAIRTKDPGSAEAAMILHLNTTKQLLETAYEQLRNAGTRKFSTRDILRLAQQQ
jgi:GntR family transcriptional regulator, transcriptional repressor for pyruvate dehydrogenase complex